MTIDLALLHELAAIVGPDGALSDAEAQAPYLTEWRGMWRGRTPLVVRPHTTAQVAAIVKICARHKIKIVPQGGNTGLVGGGVPHESGDEILLSLNRMNRIVGLDAANASLTVEAGVILQNAQEAAARAGFYLPLRIASEGSCSIGGNLSTNAGGNNVVRYGMARAMVLGLEVVLPNGEIWSDLRGLRKDNTGYDLKQCFIGAEGTLGVITAACLAMAPAPKQSQTAWIALDGIEQAVALMTLARAHLGECLSAFEYIPRLGLDMVLRHIPNAQDPLAARYPAAVLIEATSAIESDFLRGAFEAFIERAMEEGLMRDGVLAESLDQATRLWRLRESLSEAQKHEGASVKCDVSVPVSRIADFILNASRAVSHYMPGARILAFGHVGDGNIHFNPMQPSAMAREEFLSHWSAISRLIHDAAHALGGSISAEHGLGRLKIDEIERYKSPVAMDMMRALKRALDPDNIMNPGKVVRV